MTGGCGRWEQGGVMHGFWVQMEEFQLDCFYQNWIYEVLNYVSYEKLRGVNKENMHMQVAAKFALTLIL